MAAFAFLLLFTTRLAGVVYHHKRVPILPSQMEYQYPTVKQTP